MVAVMLGAGRLIRPSRPRDEKLIAYEATRTLPDDDPRRLDDGLAPLEHQHERPADRVGGAQDAVPLDHVPPPASMLSRRTWLSTMAACSPPITEMRAFGHIQRKRGLYARPHMP